MNVTIKNGTSVQTMQTICAVDAADRQPIESECADLPNSKRFSRSFYARLKYILNSNKNEKMTTGKENGQTATGCDIHRRQDEINAANIKRFLS